MTANRDRPTFTAEERGETSVPVRWLARTIMIIAIGVLVVAVVIVGNIVAGDGMPWTFGPTDAETRPLGSATTETVGSDEPDPAALVDAEDERLRAMSAVSTSGGIVAAPEYNTVVLGARPSAYTVDDLVSAGAASGLDVTGCTLTGSQRFGVEADGSALADGPNPEGYGLDHAAGLTITATSVSGRHTCGCH